MINYSFEFQMLYLNVFGCILALNHAIVALEMYLNAN